jgi:hypothetical protein
MCRHSQSTGRLSRSLTLPAIGAYFLWNAIDNNRLAIGSPITALAAITLNLGHLHQPLALP